MAGSGVRGVADSFGGGQTVAGSCRGRGGRQWVSVVDSGRGYGRQLHWVAGWGVAGSDMGRGGTQLRRVAGRWQGRAHSVSASGTVWQ